MPLVPKPTLAVLVQANVAPGTLLPKFMAEPFPLLQKEALGILFTPGTGFTFTFTVVVDVQAPAVAVIVKFVVCCTLVALASVPLIAAPLPLAATPVRFTVLSLVQLNTVPATAFGLLISICPNATAEQRVCVKGVALTVGLGLTVTVTLVTEVHIPAVAVMVKVVTC